jgi:hypothetical protein
MTEFLLATEKEGGAADSGNVMFASTHHNVLEPQV